jgi:hypothetical protein
MSAFTRAFASAKAGLEGWPTAPSAFAAILRGSPRSAASRLRMTGGVWLHQQRNTFIRGGSACRLELRMSALQVYAACAGPGAKRP